MYYYEHSADPVTEAMEEWEMAGERLRNKYNEWGEPILDENGNQCKRELFTEEPYCMIVFDKYKI